MKKPITQAELKKELSSLPGDPKQRLATVHGLSDRANDSNHIPDGARYWLDAEWRRIKACIALEEAERDCADLHPWVVALDRGKGTPSVVADCKRLTDYANA